MLDNFDKDKNEQRTFKYSRSCPSGESDQSDRLELVQKWNVSRSFQDRGSDPHPPRRHRGAEASGEGGVVDGACGGVRRGCFLWPDVGRDAERPNMGVGRMILRPHPRMVQLLDRIPEETLSSDGKRRMALVDALLTRIENRIRQEETHCEKPKHP